MRRRHAVDVQRGAHVLTQMEVAVENGLKAGKSPDGWPRNFHREPSSK